MSLPEMTFRDTGVIFQLHSDGKFPCLLPFLDEKSLILDRQGAGVSSIFAACPFRIIDDATWKWLDYIDRGMRPRQ